MTKLEQLIQQIRAELGTEFVSSFVIGTDGLSIASVSGQGNDEDGSKAARIVMVMKLAQKTSEKLNLGEVKENLITSDKLYVLVRYILDGTYVWSVAVTRAATLGNVRLMMNDYMNQISEAIPH